MPLTVKTLLEKVTLTDTAIELMRAAISETKRTGEEHGFLFCLNRERKEITPGKLCYGTKCEVPLEDCDFEVKVGTFHTHPRGLSEFSLYDLLDFVQAIANQADILHCIWGPEEDVIKCITPKRPIAPEKASEYYSRYLDEIFIYYDEWERAGKPPLEELPKELEKMGEEIKKFWGELAAEFETVLVKKV